MYCRDIEPSWIGKCRDESYGEKDEDFEDDLDESEDYEYEKRRDMDLE